MMAATRKLKPSLLAPIPPPQPVDPVTKSLREAARNFDKLVRTWTNDLGIDPSLTTRWGDFKDLRHVRHVVVHRLGYWQPGLDLKPMLAARIAAIGLNPDTYRGELPLTDLDLQISLDILRATVTELDAKL